MPTYRVTGNIQVSYTEEVEADSKEEALDQYIADFPGLPSIGNQWDENGELEVRESDVEEMG